MRPADRDAVLRTCESYTKRLAAGETDREAVAALAAEAGVQRPAIWRRLRSGGVLAPYTKLPEDAASKRRRYHRDQSSLSDRIAEPPRNVRVPQDVVRIERPVAPCWFCGEREGCRHRRSA